MESLNQVLLREDIRVGADLDAWLAHGGGEGLAKALQDPDAVIAEIARADLRGMGGAGFATHRKWAPVAAAPEGDKYIICNGNEDEPGTFKDRFLLEHTPHQVIEGALIAAGGHRGDERQPCRPVCQSASAARPYGDSPGHPAVARAPPVRGYRTAGRRVRVASCHPELGPVHRRRGDGGDRKRRGRLSVSASQTAFPC